MAPPRRRVGRPDASCAAPGAEAAPSRSPVAVAGRRRAGPARRAPAPPTEDPGFEVDPNPIATPGCECRRCSTIRRGEPVPVPGSITGDLPEDQRTDLKRALQQLKALLWPDPVRW
jgi:hypothetical protein